MQGSHRSVKSPILEIEVHEELRKSGLSRRRLEMASVEIVPGGERTSGEECSG